MRKTKKIKRSTTTKKRATRKTATRKAKSAQVKVPKGFVLISFKSLKMLNKSMIALSQAMRYGAMASELNKGAVKSHLRVLGGTLRAEGVRAK